MRRRSLGDDLGFVSPKSGFERHPVAEIASSRYALLAMTVFSV
jgi:hypothetical protein